MLLGVQILGVLFGLFMIYIVFLSYKRKEFKLAEVIFWSALWVFFILVTIFPTSLDFIVKTLSLQRPLDFLIIIGFLFLIILTFHNYLFMKKTNKKIEKLVSKLAIKKAEN